MSGTMLKTGLIGAAILATLSGAPAGSRPGANHLPPQAPAVFTVEMYDVRDLLPGAGRSTNDIEAAAVARAQAGLADLVRTVVDPSSWRDPRSSVTFQANGFVAVAQTARGHAALRRLLGALSAQRATTIAIRARFFTYREAETQALVVEAMRLDRAGPAQVVLDPAEAGRLAEALAKRPDVTEWAAPPVTVASGGRAHVAINTELLLSTRWRWDRKPAGVDVAPVDLAACEGNDLTVDATASADGRQVTLDVRPAVLFLAGDRQATDAWGRIDLPEFAVSAAAVSARVPNGHALLVSGLRARIPGDPGAGGSSPWRGRRAATALVMLTPTVTPTPVSAASSARERVQADLEALAVLARIRRWAPSTAVTTRPADNTAVTVTSPDGLLTLELQLSQDDLHTPATEEWLRRLLSQPDRRLDGRGDASSQSERNPR
jgi:hypothetical protein